MGYICLSCGTEYNRDNIVISQNSYESWCPDLQCQEKTVVEIDDMILPTIRILNQKGYNTTFCCSGHGHMVGRRNTYIAFEEYYGLGILPEGFTLENGEPICIRKWYDENLERSDFEMEIYKTMMDLLIWTEKLPDLYEDDSDILEVVKFRLLNDDGERLTTEDIIEKRNNK